VLRAYALTAGSILDDELAAIELDISRARRDASFLNEVGTLDQPIKTATMVLLRTRPYSQILSLYLELRKSMRVTLDHARLDVPLENLPSLYQSWCSLNLIAVLTDEAARLGYKAIFERLMHRHNHTLLVNVMAAGKPLLKLRHPNGTTIQVIPERTFGSSGEFRSLSFQQKPDIVIEKCLPDGDVELFLFDPKYKLDSEEPDGVEGTPKKVDIDKMHAYLDSIVRARDRKKIVKLAAILYPGTTKKFDISVCAIGANPDRQSELRSQLTASFRSIL
jgi:predicted component of viral defense system (DUF524 family)